MSTSPTRWNSKSPYQPGDRLEFVDLPDAIMVHPYVHKRATVIRVQNENVPDTYPSWEVRWDDPDIGRPGDLWYTAERWKLISRAAVFETGGNLPKPSKPIQDDTGEWKRWRDVLSPPGACACGCLVCDFHPKKTG